jgi:dTDP-4-amino-4,6-dideoxygalactose transaminase
MARPRDPIFLSPPDIGLLERDYLLRALDGGWVAPAGPELEAFEHDMASFTGWSGAVALSSGTGALHLALLACGVGPGDEVLVSTFTFAATANAISYCGGNPVFIDSDTVTWNMSPQLLADQLKDMRRRNQIPAAVVVVDLYGQCASYDDILPQCRELDIPIIEDAAEALGATYRSMPAGTLGDIGVFSFNGNKIMTTSGGGMLITPDPLVAERARYLATQARQPVIHYEHTEIGFNYRLSNLLAALGRAQLERLPDLVARRRRINELYRQLLCDVPGLAFMPISTVGEWNGWLSCVVFDDPHLRSSVQSSFGARNIECRPLWKPMHLQPVFEESAARVDGTSEHLFAHGLCLPSGSVMTDADVHFVAETVVSCVEIQC